MLTVIDVKVDVEIRAVRGSASVAAWGCAAPEQIRGLDAVIEGHAHEAASFIAENFAWRGEIDRAFEWLDRARNEKQYMWGSLVFDPAFRNLHADPRWAEFRAQDGRSEEQIRKIEI